MYTEKAFVDYNQSRWIIGENEINEIFRKSLKWGAKVLKGVTSPAEAVPDEFTRFIARKISCYTSGFAFQGDSETFIFFKQVEQLQESLGSLTQETQRLLKESGLIPSVSLIYNNIIKEFQDRPWVKINTIEKLTVALQKKYENASEQHKHFWRLAYLYPAIEEIYPGYLSDHLPIKDKNL